MVEAVRIPTRTSTRSPRTSSSPAASGCGRCSPSSPRRSAAVRESTTCPGRRRLRAGPPRVAVPRRRDRRGRHPARRRDGQRQVGQPAGDPRRRLPAVAGVGDRRVARHRGRRAAGPHDRLAVRGRDRAAAPHVRLGAAGGQLLRVDQRQDGVAVRARRRASAASSPALDRADDRGADRVGQRVRHGVPDRRRHPRRHPTDEQLGKPAGHDLVEGVYTLPVLRTLAGRRRAARSCWRCSAGRSTSPSGTRRWRSCAPTAASPRRWPPRQEWADRAVAAPRSLPESPATAALQPRRALLVDV